MIPLPLKERRQALGFTQVELSQLSGVSLPLIQKLESGQGNPSWSTMIKLGEALGFELAVLTGQPDWGLLVKAGVPLHGFPDYRGPINPLKIAVEIHKAWNLTLDPRQREALAGFLFAIQRHYPSIWRRYFLRYADEIPEQFDPGRIIKLSRLALSGLCRVL